METTETLMFMIAGVVIGIFNNRLLRFCAVLAKREQNPTKSMLIGASGYITRYIVIIAIVLLLTRFFSLPAALLFLAGMMTATIGMAVFCRRAPGDKSTEKNNRRF